MDLISLSILLPCFADRHIQLRTRLHKLVAFTIPVERVAVG